MLKRPEEILEITKKFNRAGFDVICAGQCVTGATMGDSPLDWDLYTECPQEKVRELFPEGEAIGKRTTRLDYTEFVESTHVNEADHFEGVIADIITLEGSMEEQLEIYDFTCEAVGERSNGSSVDPLGGRKDMKQKLLKPVGDFGKKVSKQPELIWKALRYVGLYGFDLNREIYDTIQKNKERASIVDKEIILNEFTTAMIGNYAGKFLKMLEGLGLTEAIIGPEGRSVNPREKKDFKMLCENIDNTKKIPLRRLGLFYMVFDKNYSKALAFLPHDEESLDYLEEAKRLCPKLYFCKNEEMLKNFIAKFGWDKYHFYDRLLKAQNIVYELENQQQFARDEILKVIIREKQPIFVEDLVIDADDIIEAGITDDRERAEYLLELLLTPVHKNRWNNERDKLLKFARGFHKSRIRRTFRNVDWLR
ncbi:MAG: hypothetical protein Q4D99_07125 [Bacillota bacterium]|nr:hypothetical protein [Bacillota bacterium]